MNLVITSFPKQKNAKLSKLLKHNLEVMEAIESKENAAELLEKHQKIVEEVLDNCESYVEMDEHEANIYMQFVSYILKKTNINTIENLMWKEVLEPKEVNKVSNAIREVVHAVGLDNIFNDFTKFTCSQLKQYEVKHVLQSVINIFTESNNDGDNMGIMLLY